MQRKKLTVVTLFIYSLLSSISIQYDWDGLEMIELWSDRFFFHLSHDILPLSDNFPFNKGGNCFFFWFYEYTNNV
jgi:hypothetical protein